MMTSKISVCVLVLVATLVKGEEADTVGSRRPVDLQKANAALKQTDEDIGSGKLYFTGTGYTVNLIPHALVLGLLTFALIFLYGDSLFGSTTDASGYGAPATGYGAPAPSYGAPEPAYGAPEPSYAAPAPSYSAPAPSYGAPATGYNAANRYYDPYAANAASALGADPYSQDVNAFSQDPAAEG
jgi:hypothetical protein